MGNALQPIYLTPGVEYDEVQPPPEPRPVDLFGDAVELLPEARTKRSELLAWRTKSLRDGVTAADYLQKQMADDYEAGNVDRMLRIAELLLPYTLPRLNAIAVVPGGPGQGTSVGGGVLRFSWQAAEAEQP